MSYTIHNVLAREVLDSRWNPTVEVEMEISSIENIEWEDAEFLGRGRAIVPSGASTGIHEALELRDGDKARYLGKWVLKAVDNVNKTINKKIIWQEFKSVAELDKLLLKLDGTANKSKLWANTILWVSMAFVSACANLEDKFIYDYVSKWKWKVLPYPMMNIINGGSHADNNVDIQEFMIVPVGAKNIKEAIRMWAEVFHTLKKILKWMWLATSVGDEWGYAPNLKSNEEALEVIMKAIKEAGYNTDQIKIALDCASSEFYKDGKYVLEWEGKTLTGSELVSLYDKWIKKYPIISIEDGASEDDFTTWKLLNAKLGDKIMTVGDDLFVTNPIRLEMWIKDKLANSILIKLNQIGSVSETIECVKMAHKNGMKAIMSHRSGETEDTFIADLAVALETWFIKTGSLSRTDRIAKYNQLIRIEEMLGKKAKYGNK